ncbi:hypothetical protein O181_055230 [Austropuccinia psidii MF-1]|uniref:EF-hand domain-containing protein n=1 Tax=Austropuccinia psidii MF-1 TaxID=1389203 RepID=A0A9Q3HV23_9BASI|nr:hypothetical protein [Austropuccinia psidii MF-1]
MHPDPSQVIHPELQQPSQETLPKASTPPSISSSHLPQGDAEALATRYKRALASPKPISPSTHSFKSSLPSSRQKTVGLAAQSSYSSDDDSSFDWNKSDESELDENEREQRHKEKVRQENDFNQQDHHLKRAKRLRKVYLSFIRLSKFVRTTLLLLLGCSITITPTIIVIVSFHNSSAKLHVLVWSIWASIIIFTSCITSILVEVFPAIVFKAFNLFYGSTPEKLKTQVELWLGVKAWIKLALSLTWCYVAIEVMFTSFFPFQAYSQLSYFHTIRKITCACFGSGLVLLIEKILLQIVKVNFHSTSLKDRLWQNNKALWALDKLAAAKDNPWAPRKLNTTIPNTPMMTGTHSPFFSGKHSRAKTSAVGVSLHPNSSKSGGESLSAAQLEKKLKAEARKATHARSGSLLSMTDQLTAAITQATSQGRKADLLGSSAYSAKKLARKLFEGLDEDQGGFLTPDEFEPYFKNRHDAIEAFQLFDKDGNGDINRKEMRNAVSRIYRERRALATSLKDMSSAVAKLDAVLLAISLLISVFIWLFIFNPHQTTAQLAPMSTIILGFSFVFGNAAKNLFESMLFIFSVHPYDVGDLVFIDESPMYVLEFGLFATTFQRVDGQVIIIPNSILSSEKHILNVRRSGSMWETTNVMVGFDTPLEALHEFRARLRQYVTDHPREWQGGLDVNIEFMQNQNLIQLIIAMEHKGNWQDWGARWDRRTMLMREMKKIMDQLNIVYKLPTQPVSFTSKHAGPRGGLADYMKSSLNRSTKSTKSKSPASNSSRAFGETSGARNNPHAGWNPTGLSSLRVHTKNL